MIAVKAKVQFQMEKPTVPINNKEDYPVIMINCMYCKMLTNIGQTIYGTKNN